MIRAVISPTLLLGFVPPVNASPGDHGSMCVARVLKSEEFAYAPMGYWLVSVKSLGLAVWRSQALCKIRCRGRELRLAKVKRSGCGAIAVCIWIL